MTGVLEKYMQKCAHCGSWRSDLNINMTAWQCKNCTNINYIEGNEAETSGKHIPQVGLISDGSSADYYKLPEDATQLQDLISHCDMNAQMGEIFRATYRYGRASHSNRMRDAKKIKFYIEAEIARLEKQANSWFDKQGNQNDSN